MNIFDICETHPSEMVEQGLKDFRESNPDTKDTIITLKDLEITPKVMSKAHTLTEEQMDWLRWEEVEKAELEFWNDCDDEE